MVWNQYTDEVHDAEIYENEVLVDDYQDYHPEQMNQEDWEAWFSRDLMNMWMSLYEYGRHSGTSSFILSGASYSDFCTFCYNFSHGYPSSLPS
jgi:hypothetical protein